MEEFQPLQYYWNLRVHDSEFLQLRAISAAYAQFVWVCLEKEGGGGYTWVGRERKINLCGSIVQISFCNSQNFKVMFKIMESSLVKTKTN